MTDRTKLMLRANCVILSIAILTSTVPPRVLAQSERSCEGQPSSECFELSEKSVQGLDQLGDILELGALLKTATASVPWIQLGASGETTVVGAAYTVYDSDWSTWRSLSNSLNAVVQERARSHCQRVALRNGLSNRERNFWIKLSRTFN